MRKGRTPSPGNPRQWLWVSGPPGLFPGLGGAGTALLCPCSPQWLWLFLHLSGAFWLAGLWPLTFCFILSFSIRSYSILMGWEVLRNPFSICQKVLCKTRGESPKGLLPGPEAALPVHSCRKWRCAAAGYPLQWGLFNSYRCQGCRPCSASPGHGLALLPACGLLLRQVPRTGSL